MKLAYAAILATLVAGTALAQDAGNVGDAIEARHGVMILMSKNLQVLGDMAKGNAAYDGATATGAATNLAALADMLTPDLFPAGSEFQKVDDSYALPTIWTNQADFLAKIAALNEATDAMKADAGKDLASLKGGMNAIGGACSACHRAYRQPED